jgi:hypothetical protein
LSQTANQAGGGCTERPSTADMLVALQMLQLGASMLGQVDWAAVQRQIVYEDTLVPMVDPTKYMRNVGKMRALPPMVRAAEQFCKAYRDNAPVMGWEVPETCK